MNERLKQIESMIQSGEIDISTPKASTTTAPKPKSGASKAAGGLGTVAKKIANAPSTVGANFVAGAGSALAGGLSFLSNAGATVGGKIVDTAGSMFGLDSTAAGDIIRNNPIAKVSRGFKAWADNTAQAIKGQNTPESGLGKLALQEAPEFAGEMFGTFGPGPLAVAGKGAQLAKAPQAVQKGITKTADAVDKAFAYASTYKPKGGIARAATEDLLSGLKYIAYEKGDIPGLTDIISEAGMTGALVGGGGLAKRTLNRFAPVATQKAKEKLLSAGATAFDKLGGAKASKWLLSKTADQMRKIGIPVDELAELDPAFVNTIKNIERIKTKNVTFDSLKKKVESTGLMDERTLSYIDAAARTENGYDKSLLTTFDDMLDTTMKSVKESGEAGKNVLTGLDKEAAFMQKGLLDLQVIQDDYYKPIREFIDSDQAVMTVDVLTPVLDRFDNKLKEFRIDFDPEKGLSGKDILNQNIDISSDSANKLANTYNTIRNEVKKMTEAGMDGEIMTIGARKIQTEINGLDTLIARAKKNQRDNKTYAILSDMRSALSDSLDTILPDELVAKKAQYSKIQGVMSRLKKISSGLTEVDAATLAKRFGPEAAAQMSEKAAKKKTKINTDKLLKLAVGGSGNKTDYQAALNDLHELGVEFGLPDLMFGLQKGAFGVQIDAALKANAPRSSDATLRRAGEFATGGAAGAAGSNMAREAYRLVTDILTGNQKNDEILKQLIESAKNLD